MDSFFECRNCGYMIVNFTEDDYLDDFGSLCYCQVESHQEEDSDIEESVGDITEAVINESTINYGIDPFTGQRVGNLKEVVYRNSERRGLTMTPTTKKTAPAVATAAAANENLPKDSIPTLYMLKCGANTADSFGTWSGALLPKSD